MEGIYKLKVSVGRITFELESHDKDWVEQKQKSLIGDLFNNPETVAKLANLDSEEGTPAALEIGSASVTIQEFYNRYVKPANLSRIQTALYLFYYLEKIEKKAEIRTGDVKEAFKQLAYPKYSSFNFADILNQLKRQGLINKIDHHWKLTLTGVDQVLSGLRTD